MRPSTPPPSFSFIYFFADYSISVPQGATSLAVHPPSGRLCFAVAGGGGRSQAEVACAWMDGRRKAVLWTRATLPVSLAFSDDGATVYWADSGESGLGVASCWREN